MRSLLSLLCLLAWLLSSILGEEAGIHWSDLSVSTDQGSTILHRFSGFVGNGHVCGVIGPSGAGKSSFLTALGGSSSLSVEGSVWFRNDEGDATSLSLQQGQVAYLQQQDSFFHMLTVRETLELAAYLEFPNKSKKERDNLIDRNLDALGLANVAYRVVGDRTNVGGAGLSGGERRRLSVGIELISRPQLFLADESTTGLDSSQAVKIVKLVVDLARDRQIPAIVSLHQPRASIWKMLDSFILLAPHGRVCYSGPRQEALSYFTNLGYDCPEETNPAEFFIDLVSLDTEDPVVEQEDKDRIEFFVRSFQDFQEKETLNEPIVNNTAAATNGNHAKTVHTPLRRFAALLLRSWRQNIRNTQYNAARLAASIGSSVLFSQIFKSVRKNVPIARSIADRTALLSFGVINMSMMALMKTVHLFSKERAVVDREQMRQQYSSLEYLLSKVIAEIPLDTFFAAVFTTVLKAVTGLRISWSKLTATFALMTAAGASLGFAIGSCSKDGDTAMAIGLPIMVLFMVVGVINPSGVDKNSPPPMVVKLLKQISPIKWAIEGLLVGEFEGMDLRPKKQLPFQRLRDLPKIGAFVMVKNGDQILEVLGLEDTTYEGVMKHMVVLSVVNLMISWIGLEWNRASSHNGIKPSTKSSRMNTNAPQTLQPPVAALK